MEFVGQPLTGKLLRNAHINSIQRCSNVIAAVAYAGNDQRWWFEDCLRKGKSLEFFGRYDGTCPIDTQLLEWALQPRHLANLSWRVVPTYLHAKVIWWVGQGAYIGSANLTDRAWNKNYEGGVFVPDEELETSGMVIQLLAFFSGLRARSEPLRQEHLDAQRAIEKERDGLMAQLRKIEQRFDDADPTVKHALNPIGVPTDLKSNDAFRRFYDEWIATLQIMRDIASFVSLPENRPSWIGEQVPPGVQADQFLHAYYYREVRGSGEKDAYMTFHERNRKNPTSALLAQLSWWKRSDFDVSQEMWTINNLAPVVRQNFARDRVLSLSEQEWVESVAGVHAFNQHAMHVSNALLGLQPYQTIAAKTEGLARWMWSQRTAEGRSPLEVIHYVAWGGTVAETVDRLWTACNSPAWRLAHMKTSILGELIGWMNPDAFPPRNRRTSKALRALGYDVGVDL